MEKNKIINLPNLLSLFRIGLIPLMVWLYIFKEKNIACALVLLLSGLTDILDGRIARKYGLVSDFGKVIDPVADKLTQFSLLLAASTKFPLMVPLAALLFLKEFVLGLSCLRAIKNSGKIHSSCWHGKIAAFLIYFSLGLHILWGNIPEILTLLLLSLCFISTGFSSVFYFKRNLKEILKSGK